MTKSIVSLLLAASLMGGVNGDFGPGKGVEESFKEQSMAPKTEKLIYDETVDAWNKGYDCGFDDSKQIFRKKGWREGALAGTLTVVAIGAIWWLCKATEKVAEKVAEKVVENL